MISKWSRHSRRSVPMKLSAMAFARGARTGVRMMRMSAPAKTASKAAVNLAISVADQEPELLGVVAEVHEQVAGLLGHPGAGGMGGDPGEVYAAAAVLDHQEHVEAAQEDGVDVGEVDREDRLGVRGEEMAPGRSGAVRSGIDPGDLRISTPSTGRSGGRGRSVRRGCVGTPILGFPGPSAAPAPGRVAQRAAGLVVVGGRSIGGRPMGVPAQKCSG